MNRFRSLQLYVWPATTCHRVVYQIQLERNGVRINGKLRKLITHPKGIHHLEPLANSDSSVIYFAAGKSSHYNGGLYCSDKEPCKVTNVLENMTDNCTEIKKVGRFKGILVFTDVGGSSSKVVQSIGQESRNSCRRWKRRSARWDWKKLQLLSSARHLQCFRYTFHNGCCCRENQAYEGLSGTTNFLEHLGILYDTFGVTCKASTSQPFTPEQVIQNMNTLDEYIKATMTDECQRSKQPQGGLNNEWSSRNSVPEDTNLYRDSTEWCEVPYA